MRQNNEEFSLKDLWNFIIPKLWMIVVVAIIGAVSTLVYTKTHNAMTYTVSTSLFVESISEVGDVKNSNVTVSKQRVPLYMEIIKTNRDFHEVVLQTMTEAEREAFGFSLEESELDSTLKKLASMIRTEVITTENSGELEMFHVYVSSSDLDCALRVAEIIKDLALVKQPENQTPKAAECSACKTSVPMSNPLYSSYIDGDFFVCPSCGASTRIHNPIYENIGLPSTMSCVDSPRFSSSSARYNPIMSAAIGGFAVALVAIFILFFYSAMDDRVRNRKTLEKNFEVPILGVIPKVTLESAPKKTSILKSWRGKDHEG